jgi:hypothetical protein
MNKTNYTHRPATPAEIAEIIQQSLLANNTLLSIEIGRLSKEISKLCADNRLLREEMTEQTLILQDEVAEQGLAAQQSITAILRREMQDQKQEIVTIVNESTEEVLRAVAHHTHNLEDSIRDDIAAVRDRLNQHIKPREAGRLQVL